MTPRSLFLIVLKIFGILMLKNLIIAFLTLLSFAGALSLASATWWNFAVELIVVVFLLACIYFLLFRTAKVLDLLRLDQGFSEKQFSLDLSMTDLLAIALIVAGVVILVIAIPDFCHAVTGYLSLRRLAMNGHMTALSTVIYSGVKILLGLLIIGERKRIVAFITKKETKEQGTEELDSL